MARLRSTEDRGPSHWYLHSRRFQIGPIVEHVGCEAPIGLCSNSRKLRRCRRSSSCGAIGNGLCYRVVSPRRSHGSLVGNHLHSRHDSRFPSASLRFSHSACWAITSASSASEGLHATGLAHFSECGGCLFKYKQIGFRGGLSSATAVTLAHLPCSSGVVNVLEAWEVNAAN